ncbi:alpha subunit [Rhizoctonia solani]|uniref:Alpha subunit n=1 Tax=Rhizoctonia solani TaxID=456999 RepID=A0A8H7LFB1_9AGAM|nr:alpha subunit [Rhizoctonia solani]
MWVTKQDAFQLQSQGRLPGEKLHIIMRGVSRYGSYTSQLYTTSRSDGEKGDRRKDSQNSNHVRILSLCVDWLAGTGPGEVSGVPTLLSSAERFSSRLELRREQAERLASELIDAQIAREAEARAEHRRHNPELRLLLLGQAESGKSTLLKQFQMLYAPHTLDAERAAWRGVVFLNIIKALRTICETHDFEYGSNNGTPAVYDPWSDAYTPPASPKGTPGRDNLTTVKLHLAPLLGLEATLAQRIGSGFNLAGRTEFCVRRGWQDNTQFTRPSSGKRKVRSRSGSVDADRGIGNGKAPESELHLDVQTVLADCRSDIQALWAHPSLKVLVQRRRLRLEDASIFFLDELNRITQPGYLPSDDDILRARIRTIGISEWSFQFTYPGKKNLCNWRDISSTIGWDTGMSAWFDIGSSLGLEAHDHGGISSQQAVTSHGEEYGGDQFWRVDWLQLRLELTPASGIYGSFGLPGGARSQRAHWAPYFEDATAIVFLAPISAYDQYLEEDARTNRIDDSLQLWTQITSSPILKEVHLVLFLNKCDVLRGKLAAGVKVKK